MKKHIPLEKLRACVMLLFCAVLALFHTGATAEEGDTVDSSARSAVLIERETGRVLLSHCPEEPLPMASTTKVMTALMALEYGRLDEMVTVGKNAYGVPGTSIYLGLGERISLRDLLYGLMLASGNDAAVAIAEHIGGEVDTFCRMMTQRAAELGCKDTVFVNPNGLPARGHHTTAHDLALIARQAMSYPLFREIVSTRRASIPWEGRSYHRVLNNKNRLLSTYEGATGIKTGYTRAAGRCLVFGARRDGLEVIGVVLNCGDWFDEAARLMDLAFERYELFTALDEGETLRALPVENARQDAAYVCAGGKLCAPVEKGVVPAVEYDMPEKLEAGMHLGDTVGQARLTLNGETVAAVPLVLREELLYCDYAFELERLFQHWTAVPGRALEP